jgi:hypothetical protein
MKGQKKSIPVHLVHVSFIKIPKIANVFSPEVIFRPREATSFEYSVS